MRNSKKKKKMKNIREELTMLTEKKTSSHPNNSSHFSCKLFWRSLFREGIFSCVINIARKCVTCITTFNLHSLVIYNHPRGKEKRLNFQFDLFDTNHEAIQ